MCVCVRAQVRLQDNNIFRPQSWLTGLTNKVNK